MTISGASTPGSAWFLEGITSLQQQQAKTVRQLSSGYQVQDAADAPGLTPQLVSLGSSLASVQAWQSSITRAQTETGAADSAIGTGVTLLQNAQSLAVQGADSSATATTRQNLAAQVQNIQQQIVSLANTSVAGRYIFGGQADQSATYQYDAASAVGADRLTTQNGGPALVNPEGVTVYQGLTAQQVFDARDNAGNPAAGNVLNALQSLRNALDANDQTGVSNALTLVRSASDYLNQQQGAYGAAEQRLTGEQNTAASQVTSLKTSISAIRDTDVTQAATDLSQETVAQSAAYGAESLISKKTLFDYIG